MALASTLVGEVVGVTIVKSPPATRMGFETSFGNVCLQLANTPRSLRYQNVLEALNNNSDM